MAAEKHPDALRTIGEVADELGIATHVLRFWESKFFQIKPQKRRGRRYYRPEDIKTITQIKALLYGQGYTIRGVQKFLAQKPLAQEANNNEPQIRQSFNTDLFGNKLADEAINSVREDEEFRGLSPKDRAALNNILNGLNQIKEKLKQAA